MCTKVQYNQIQEKEGKLTHHTDPGEDFEIEYPDDFLLLCRGPSQIVVVVRIHLTQHSEFLICIVRLRVAVQT